MPAERSNGLIGKWVEQLAAEMIQQVLVDGEAHLTLNAFSHLVFSKDAEKIWIPWNAWWKENGKRWLCTSDDGIRSALALSKRKPSA